MFLQSRMFIFASCLLAICLTSLVKIAPAEATLFSNQYVSFELPPNWSCKNDGTEWVCVSQLEKQAKEAIIILTAKEAGPTDSIESYTAHLNMVRSLPDATGKLIPSQKLSIKQRTINNHPWVDAMHLGSEITSYYTRYLATVKDRLAIAITFSAHKSHYTKYSQDFLKSIDSMRVIVKKDLFNSTTENTPSGGGMEQMGTEQPDPFAMAGMQAPPEPTPAKKPYLRYALGLLLVVAAVAVYMMRKK